MKKDALLVLEDGNTFQGQSIGYKGTTIGEVVFNTALTGYQEILTDPSYTKQIVTLTYPHIGNVGTNSADEESNKVYSAGLIVRDVPLVYSNWRATESLQNYLKRNQIVAIADIDTRRLTRILREKGAQNGCIIAGNDLSAKQALTLAKKFPGLKGMDLAKEVSTKKPYVWKMGTWQLSTNDFSTLKNKKYHIVAYDFGIKANILRMLVERNCEITVVPAKTPATDVLSMQPDGVFLSNGPGDPEPCNYAIQAIQAILAKKIPIFGICLGHQLLALASGAKTVKMKFGHHGANHPVQDLESKQVMITSQNHGFSVDETSLPNNLQATHRSLFDHTLQGIKRTDCPAISFQGHPEASPGPHDVAPLFDAFIDMMQAKGEK